MKRWMLSLLQVHLTGTTPQQKAEAKDTQIIINPW